MQIVEYFGYRSFSYPPSRRLTSTPIRVIEVGEHFGPDHISSSRLILWVGQNYHFKLIKRRTTTAVAISSISVVPDIARTKHAVQQPERHPVWCMLAGCRATIEQLSLN